MDQPQRLSSNELARAHRAKAIAFSLAGSHYRALYYFVEALECVEKDTVLLGTILRDFGMSELRFTLTDRMSRGERRFHLNKAESTFTESVRYLKESTDAAGILELAVTESFIGWLMLIRGDRTAARAKMDSQRLTIEQGGNPVYLLNFEMSYIRTVSRRERQAVKDRIVPLIDETGDLRRYDELRLIMIGGDRLYRFVACRPLIIQIAKQLLRK